MIVSLKQRKISLEPRIKLNHNIYKDYAYNAVNDIFLAKQESKICELHIYVQIRTVVWVTILSLTHMTIHISNANRTAHLKLPQDYP